MFLKNKPKAKTDTADSKAPKKDALPSIITRDMNLLGNIISDGVIDFDGRIDGNIRCHTLNVRPHAMINGEVVADMVSVYGRIRGTIRAKHVVLHASCHIEGVILHQSISIEDGAFIDGKCKRTDKPESEDGEEEAFEESETHMKMLENLRLIS